MPKIKKAILTFDDGYHEDYTTAFPILKERGIVATSYLTTNNMGRRGYLDWDEIKEMIKGGWDFQCHTHNHMMLDKLSDEDIEKEILFSKNTFIEHTLPQPEHVAYPYGVRNDRIINVMKKHFKTARGGTGSKGTQYDIKSYGLHGKIDVCELDNDVLFIHTHEISDTHRGFGVTIDRFIEILDHLKDYKFLTIKEYYNESGRNGSW